MSNGHGNGDGGIGCGGAIALCLVVLVCAYFGCLLWVANANDTMCKDAGWTGGLASGIADTECYEKGVAVGSGGEVRHACSVAAIVDGTCGRIFEDVE